MFDLYIAVLRVLALTASSALARGGLIEVLIAAGQWLMEFYIIAVEYSCQNSTSEKVSALWWSCGRLG